MHSPEIPCLAGPMQVGEIEGTQKRKTALTCIKVSALTGHFTLRCICEMIGSL